MRFSPPHFILVANLLLLTVAPVLGAEPSATLDSIARLMDEQAIAVMRIDTTHAKPELINRLYSMMPDIIQDIRSPQEAIGFAYRLQSEVEPETYWVFSLPNASRIPAFCVTPHDAGKRISPKATMVDGLVLDGQPTRIKSALAARDAALQEEASNLHRADLATAFAAVVDAPIAFVFVPSADQRRVLHELTPELPGELGGKHLRDLLRTIDWFAVGYESDDALRMVLNTPSEEAAMTATENVTALLKALTAAARIDQTVSAAPEILRKLAPLAEAVRPQQRGNQVILELDSQQLASTLQPAFAAATNAADRQAAMHRLKTIAIAMHNHHSAVKDANGKHRFPDAASMSPDGKPLLSWRVHVLPYLDQEALYREFHLDEPWDSEHNKKLIERMPDVYRLPGVKVAEGKTCVLLPVGQSTIYAKGQGQQIREITDGTSNTILAVEADDEHAVIWTAPEDLPYDSEKPSAGLGRHYGDGFLALVADGSVRFLPASIEEQQLKALFSPAGGEVIDRSK